MAVYHSKIANASAKKIGNFPLLTFRTKIRGPILNLVKEDEAEGLDIIDEALFYFKSNVFFKRYEIQNESDRVLIYLILYITECLKKLQKCTKKSQALNEMHSLAISKFDIPGDANFVLPTVYTRPASANEADTLRQYLTQLRQECGLRLCDKVFECPEDTPANDSMKPSKWWTCFAKRKFMDISLAQPGY